MGITLRGVIDAFEEIAIKEDGDRKLKAWLIDRLLDLKRNDFPWWGKNQSSDLIVFGDGEILLVLRRERVNGQQLHGLPIKPYCMYILTVFKKFRQLVNFLDTDQAYDSQSARRPILNLYDILRDGLTRPVPPAHTCGIDENCPACELEKSKGGP